MSQADTKVFQAFNAIARFARDLNTTLQVPEIVLLGTIGSGKSSLIDAFIGHPLLPSVSTKRIIHVNLINNSELETPRITLKRDSLKDKSGEDKVVSIDELEKEIIARNEISHVPIVINYEYKYTWNITFIDTPGLPSGKGQSEVPPTEVEEILVELAKPSNRIVLCVEEGSSSEMMSLVKKIDPRLDRTIFVFNKFAEQLKNITTTRDLNRFFSSTASTDTNCFFTSLIGDKERAQYRDKSKYKQKLAEQVHADMQLLEQLQFDRRYASNIGVVGLKRHLLEITWKKYQDTIPELLKRIRSFKKQSEQKLAHIENQIKSLDINKLRGAAARYVMHFLQSIEKLLSGTLEGNPSIHGQTLKEEKLQDETGEWVSFDHTVISVEKDWNIPQADNRLYGGQQFERLLAEFRAVVEHRKMNTLTLDDIATAAGPLKLNNSANCTWAATDIAQKYIQKTLKPLITQLFKRAIYIMKRQVTIVESMLLLNKKHRKPYSDDQSILDDVEQYPFFISDVTSLYYKFVEETAEKCKQKCLDEFYSTRLLYWESTNLDQKTISSINPKSSSEDAKKAVQKLATETFETVRDRIAKNVILKTYNYFLVPLQTELWGAIQGNITCLTDVELRESFEVEATMKKLEEQKNEMDSVLSKFAEQENNFLKYANEFAKCNPRELDV